MVCNLWDFPILRKGVSMYSHEFMKFLINYQKPEFDENLGKEVKNFRFKLMDIIFASVLLVSKK